MVLNEEFKAVSCRVAGNAAFAFFSALAGLNIAGVTEDKALFAALFMAVIQGGLAGSSEFKRWAEKQGKGLGSSMFMLI